MYVINKIKIAIYRISEIKVNIHEILQYLKIDSGDFFE